MDDDEGLDDGQLRMDNVDHEWMDGDDGWMIIDE